MEEEEENEGGGKGKEEEEKEIGGYRKMKGENCLT